VSAASIGVDAGSTTWKAVAIDAQGRVVASRVEPAEPRIEEQTRRGLRQLRQQTGSSEAIAVGATGYGRKQVRGATRELTEITCHALGAFHKMKRPGLLIDVGGQDTKAIVIGPDGKVQDFVMNDKCAAGTGRFLEVILGRLKVSYEDIEILTSKASRPVAISSTCTVFAESEVISLISQGLPLEGILLGLHRALAERISALAGRLAAGHELMMSGGVALNRAVVRALSEKLGKPVVVVPDPQTTGALGAALSVI
jgi:predicted CoA-substrate-specific enzyme activase